MRHPEVTPVAKGGTQMATITLATAAENPKLAFMAQVERAIAVSETAAPDDHDSILAILDKLDERTIEPEDHDQLLALIAKYGPPAS